MSGKTRELKRRIKGINTMKQLTKAMELVSTSKYKKHQKFVMASRPYSQAMEGILANIGKVIKEERHSLYVKRQEVKARAFIIIGSDRGLCGGYNSAIIKEYKAFIEANRQKQELYVVGGKLLEFLPSELIQERYSLPLLEESQEFSDRIIAPLIKRYLIGEIDEVVLIYTEFISTVSSKAVVKKMLPLEELIISEGVSSYEIESDYTGLIDGWNIPILSQAEMILDKLLPKYLGVRIYQALLESTASEQASRMRAMQNATTNAKESLDHLSLELNRERQSAITQENSEIVAGAEAIQG